MKVKEITNAIEAVAPLYLQESWDNSGMQVGDPDCEVSGVLLCTDVREEIVDEAIERGANMIISHHPLLFRGLKKIVGRSYQERIVAKAIKHDITIYCAHTNMDSTVGGVNFKMAEKMGLADLQPLQGPVVDGKWCGVVGTLPAPMPAEAFIRMLKERFGVASVRANELLQREVRRVALCGGAGSFMLADALRAGADAFVTGEMGYHEFFGHEQHIQICVIGHYESEQYTTEIFRDIISRECPEVKTCIAETQTNPIVYL